MRILWILRALRLFVSLNGCIVAYPDQFPKKRAYRKLTCLTVENEHSQLPNLSLLKPAPTELVFGT
jgi:hypothetical protein